MAIFSDVKEPVGGSIEEKRDFQIGLLAKRVEILEDLVLALLDGRVDDKILANYRRELRTPHLPVQTTILQIVGDAVLKRLADRD